MPCLSRCARIPFLVWLLAAALAAMLPAQQRTPKKPAAAEVVDVLFVGNSYTHGNDLPAFVAALGAATKPRRTIVTRMIAPGGFTLQQHWEATGDDAPRTVLEKTPPQFLVLQDQSQMPLLDPDRLADFAAKFAALAATKQCRTVLFTTWARANDPAAQDRITAAYAAAAEAGKALLAPVGGAWQKMLATHKGAKLHIEDGSHPTPAGTYLAACVIHATMFGGDVRAYPDKLVRTDGKGNEVVLVDLSTAEGKRLREAAAAVLTKTTR